MLMSAGCVTSGSGSGELRVDIPDTCERQLKTVDEPALRAGQDARARLGQYKGALAEANGRIVDGRECFAGIRESYKRQ